MKYCKNCEIYIEDSKINCPLCGKCIDEQNAKNRQINQNTIYPNINYKPNNQAYISTKIIIGLILVSLLCIGINLLTTNCLNWSLFVAVSCVFSIFAIMLPIKHYVNVEKIMINNSIFVPLLLLFYELYTHSWGWGLCIAIPSFWTAISLTSFLLAFIKGYMDFDKAIPLVINTIFLIILSVFLIVFNQFKIVCICEMFVSIILICTIFTIRFKRSIKSFIKNFRL